MEMVQGVISIQRLQSMQQKKARRINRDSKQSIVSNINQKAVSTLFSNRSQDTKSKLHLSKDSYLREFKKTKIKLNTLSTLGGLNIQEQIKKEITSVDQTLKKCQMQIQTMNIVKSDKAQFLHLEEAIRMKDQTIKILTQQIQNLKKSDRTIIEEDSPTLAHRQNENSDKQPLFKLAQEIKHEKEQLLKMQEEHRDKYQNYKRIKHLIHEIQIKYAHKFDQKGKEDYGNYLISYQEFKEKSKNKKEDITSAKGKRIDFYHHLPPEKNTNTNTNNNNNNPSRNMKDLITRKNITTAALKNSRKKHNVEMSQLLAKLDFLKDEDAHLTQKIKQKEQQLDSMQKKFSQRKTQNRNINRNPLLHFHS